MKLKQNLYAQYYVLSNGCVQFIVVLLRSVNIKFGTKFIVALCDVDDEKCHPVTYNLFK
jgi:hypothetical protein